MDRCSITAFSRAQRGPSWKLFSKPRFFPFDALCCPVRLCLVIAGWLMIFCPPAAAEKALQTPAGGAEVKTGFIPIRGDKESGENDFTPPRGYRILHSSAALHGLMVRSIRFEGLSRTRSFRLHHFMDTSPGRPFDHEIFEEDMRRIRNEELFRDMRVYAKYGENSVSLIIYMRDKWSLLPYFNFVRGGGSYQLVFGAYDVNILGAMFMMDANFIVFDGRPSGILYLSVPRLWGLPLQAGIDGGLSRSIRTVYGPRTSPQYIYAMQSQWFDVSIASEPVPWVEIKLWQKFSWNTIEFAKLSPLDDVLPTGGRRAVTGLMVSLGKVSYDNYLMHGLKLTAWASGAFKALGSNEDFLRLTWDMRGYWRFGPRGGNLAARLHGGYLHRGNFLDEYSLGSFSGLRGFRYAQFVGKSYVAGSFEYRTALLPVEFPIVSKLHEVFRGKTLRMQGVAFTEMGSMAGSLEHATTESGRMLWSIGAGFRGIFIPFYKAVLRVDLCYTLEPFRSFDLMIATQQAF